jgi:hypothetical protein
MGCDYFIIKQLEITHINSYDLENDITCIELDRERCYFNDESDSYDSDDTFDNEYMNSRFDRKYSKYLQVNYKPRILFQNGKWKNENVENKYKKMIRDKIGDDIIINIIKKEVRYFR